MRHLTGGLFYVIGGALAGVLSALTTIENAGVEQLGSSGPWQSRTEGLRGAASLYVEASYLLSGRLPPATGQFTEAVAAADGEGSALSSSCAYVIASTASLPPWWSISIISSGEPPESRQSVIDSDTVIREADGAIRIIASLQPQPGNWIKVAPARRFSVLYTALTGISRAAAHVPPFSIAREGC